MELTADKMDVSRLSGDAFAHGNVKASLMDSEAGTGTLAGQGVALGGKGPSHAIASELQFNQATGEATFRGQARLWQQANSVAAPLIVLDQARHTLAAHSTNAMEPVRAVLLSAGRPENQNPDSEAKKVAAKPATPSVIRVRGGDLKYSDVERKAWMSGGALGSVVAETGTAVSTSNEVELTLLPAAPHGTEKAGAPQSGTAQVDRMVARGHVLLTSLGRRGTGEQLVYTGTTGEYVLTGTPTVPPKMIDATLGSVTGEALIFHGRDDSVSIEGGGRKTRAETTAPR
jgi:lipopolysaccharide export system protein LptA